MRAAVMRDHRMVVDEFPDPVPGEGQVLARPIACGVCGSDLHFLRHSDKMTELGQEMREGYTLDTSRDVFMGHEFACEVLELGPHASGVQPGDIVVSMPA